MKQLIINADAEHLPLADGCVDLTLTSPPYVDARWYGDRQKHARKCVEWVDWIIGVVRECCRVTTGLVLVNCAGVTRQHRYQPAPEMLLSEWWKQGGECWRPAYWHRVGIPGSGGKQWLRADIEYVLAFKANPGPIPWADNTACGHPPKWGPGGEMAHRLSSGARVNQWGPVGSSRGFGAKKANGTLKATDRPSHKLSSKWGSGGKFPETQGRKTGRRIITIPRDGMHNGQDNTIYNEPVLANPGNLVKVIVGGGAMGHKLAHENEAPFPVKLATFFVKSFCPPGGTVLDPFAGSHTVAQAAIENGRGYICSDIRMSQCELGRRRIKSLEPSLFAGRGAA